MAPRTKEDQLRDIYHTAYLLRQKLVPDVIPAILHHAGLFQRHTHNIRNDHPVSVTERGAPYLCMLTPPIKSSARAKHPVRKVVFAIQSCDQGWADRMDGGSWTWFTAGIVRDQEGDDGASTEFDGGVRLSKEVLEDAMQDHELHESATTKFLTAERQIYRNEVATKEFRTYIVEWTVDSANAEEREWVANLQNGDRVAVRAWAQFGGWMNKIKSVSVATYTAAVI